MKCIVNGAEKIKEQNYINWTNMGHSLKAGGKCSTPKTVITSGWD